MVQKIKLGILVSYDYEFLYNALPLLYEHSDEITLAIDANYRTWAGERYKLPDSFFDWIKYVDKDKKINIYLDDFFDRRLTPMENETRERNMLAKEMGPDGWHLQIDCDELFYSFSEFVLYLKKQKDESPLQISVYGISVFKKLEDGYLYVKNSLEDVPVATNSPDYKYGRKGKQRKIYAPFLMINQNLSRTELDLYKKLTNWGHSRDFDVDNFFNSWCLVNKSNYESIRQFHPINKRKWNRLEYVKNLEQLSSFRIPFKTKVMHFLKQKKTQWIRKSIDELLK